MKHYILLCIVIGMTVPVGAAGDDHAPSTAAESTESVTPVREPTGPLTLQDAVALALMGSPELAPFAWQERANEARRLQAGRRINPALSIDVEDVLGTGAFSGGSQAQTTLQLSQVIELGGKRKARTNVASEARGITQSEYEVIRVDVLADVTQRFIHVVASQQSLELAIVNRQLAQDALETVEIRATAGKASGLEVVKAQLSLARGEVLVKGATHELQAARKVLGASWGNSEPVFERVEADLFARRPIPPYQELVSHLSTGPGVARWISEKRLREAEVKLADALRVPNLTLGAGIRRLESSGDGALVFGLSMPIPVFDRNQGGKAESRALLGRAEAEHEAATFRLSSLLLGLYEEAVHEALVMEGLENEILPRAEEVLEISREGFSHGRFSYLDVLDAQRTVYEVRHEYIRTATSYHQFLVEIERLTGQPFNSGGLQR